MQGLLTAQRVNILLINFGGECSHIHSSSQALVKLAQKNRFCPFCAGKKCQRKRSPKESCKVNYFRYLRRKLFI